MGNGDGRRVEVTETVTETLNGVLETRREVTELVETREVVERLHGDVVKDAHTHTGSEGQ